MGVINFSVSIAQPKKKIEKINKPRTITQRKKANYTIVEKDVEGVVTEIDGTIFVILNDELRLSIYPKNFNCKGISILYRKINGYYITYTRSSDDELRAMPNYYFPFKPGSKVKGLHIIDNDTHYFNIIKILR